MIETVILDYCPRPTECHLNAGLSGKKFAALRVRLGPGLCGGTIFQICDGFSRLPRTAIVLLERGQQVS